MKRKKIKIQTTIRCGHILRFLWLWKVATTATIAKKFYSGSTKEACYRRLMRLAKGRYIHPVSSKNGEDFVWSLDKNGFAYLKDELPPGTENGYLSDCPGHDLIVSAAHLGDWICDKPKDWNLFTEQQLKRIAKESYPSWVPKSKIHRPDGYWHFSNGIGSRLLALEVELSQKKLTEYETTGRYYSLDAHVDCVIWITGPLVNPNSIYTAIQKAIGTKKNPHSFIALKDFMRNYWQAKVNVGSNVGATIQSLLVQGPSNGPPVPESLHFFDTRKYPVNSVANNNLQKHDFFHVTGVISP